ncbi:MAG: DUF4349 domain-containing protein [Ilumatobacteraceae bacterium]
MAALSLSIAGCAAEDRESSTESGGAPSATAGDVAGGGSEAPADDAGGDGTVDLPAYTPQAGRSLIVRMTVGLRVVEVGPAVDALIRLADEHDGQLANSSVDISSPEYANGQLVFRMPPEQVDPFIAGLDPAVGRTVSLNGSTEDVTGQLRDLDAQIEMAEISVDRVKTLLAGATKLADIILLEGELTTRQTTLEQLRAVKADLSQQVALATVTVYLETAPADALDDTDSGVLSDIGDAFARGWDAFVSALVGVLLVLGWSAPFVIAAGLVLVAASRLRRRVRRNRAAAPSTPPFRDEDLHTS